MEDSLLIIKFTVTLWKLEQCDAARQTYRAMKWGARKDSFAYTAKSLFTLIFSDTATVANSLTVFPKVKHDIIT